MLISTNGFVNFDNANGASSGNAIAAFNYDLITSNSGGIYYQNLNSQSSDFNSIKSDLKRLNSNFVPTNIFRITYYNVPDYRTRSYLATFQIILASDASKSYVLLKYTSCLTGYSLTTMQAIYYRLSNGQQMSNQISINPCTSSNVNLVGTWVFDVNSNIFCLFCSLKWVYRIDWTIFLVSYLFIFQFKIIFFQFLRYSNDDNNDNKNINFDYNYNIKFASKFSSFCHANIRE